MREKERAHLPLLQPVPSAANVCAVVVAYFPDEGFEARLQKILPQVARLVIVDNTPEAVSLSPQMVATWGARLYCIANHINKGVATALNQGIEYALHQGCCWVLTLDQDTQCYPHMIDTLGSIYERCSSKPALMGCNYLDPRNHKPRVPAQGSLWLEQKTVITSGSLVNAIVALQIGGFRDDYFIDQVDHEFCLRLRAQGCHVVISREPLMAHSVGCPGGMNLPLLGILPNHSPLRKYYIARNSVATISTYWRHEPEWCMRRLVRLMLGLAYMAILEENRFAKVRAFMAGIADGILHRMGPSWRKWLVSPD